MMDFLLVLILSFDTLLACLAYGAKQIKIPFFSKLTLAVVGTLFLSLSLLGRHALSGVLSEEVIRWVGFSVLLLLALMNLGENALKKWVSRHVPMEHSVKFNCVRFTLNVYVDKTCADKDCSNTLSVPEALFLAIPLSIDSLVTGLSMESGWMHSFLLIGCSLLCGLGSAFLGTKAGGLFHSREKDHSWICGILLLGMAVLKLR